MALSPEDKARLLELAGKKPGDTDEPDGNLAGDVAAPLPPGQFHLAGRLRPSRLSPLAVRILLIASVPVCLLVALAIYVARWDLHQMDVDAVFDSRAGLSFSTKLRREIDEQKSKRRLLDKAHAQGYANEHLAAYATAGEVLQLEADHAEAKAFRRDSLNRQVVVARGLLESGDVDEAIVQTKRVLEVQVEHEGALALLRACGNDLARRAKLAVEAKEYAKAGEYVLRSEALVPDQPLALQLHGRLVQYHVRYADQLYVGKAYLRALHEITLAHRLDPANTRAQEVFEKIDERVSFPEIKINSVMSVRGRPRTMVTIDGKTMQLVPEQEYGNVRATLIDPAVGEVIFTQIYTGEQRLMYKPRGGDWIAP